MSITVSIQYTVDCEGSCMEHPPCEQESDDIGAILQKLIQDPNCKFTGQVSVDEDGTDEPPTVFSVKSSGVFSVISSGATTNTKNSGGNK